LVEPVSRTPWNVSTSVAVRGGAAISALDQSAGDPSVVETSAVTIVGATGEGVVAGACRMTSMTNVGPCQTGLVKGS
jgi:hypothetical protein